jgi:hypothetical protein
MENEIAKKTIPPLSSPSTEMVREFRGKSKSIVYEYLVLEYLR